MKTNTNAETKLNRRRCVCAIVVSVAVLQLGILNSALAESQKRDDARTNKTTIKASFASVKQIDAGVLNVGYAEVGPADGPTVILLHGWPYDIYSFVDVAPLLAENGYRVIVPYLRGYGTTRFLSNDTVRNGEPAAVAVDIIAVMDALKIDKAILAGFDWGCAHGRYYCSALAGTLQRTCFGQRLSDRQPGIGQDPVTAEGRARVVVSVLFRHRTRSGRLRQEPARFCQVDLAASVS